jgi:hypothetical protein
VFEFDSTIEQPLLVARQPPRPLQFTQPSTQSLLSQ